MRNLLFLFVLLLFTQVRAQNFEWVSQQSVSAGQYIKMDKAGNLYVVGNSISKYSPQGVLIWTAPIGIDPRITFDNNNNLYITYADSVNYYISKWDTAGNILEKSIFYTYKHNGWKVSLRGLDADAQGNYYISGQFIDTVTIGNFMLISSNAGKGWNLFVAKFNSQGICMWAKQSDYGNLYWAHSLHADASGNTYIGGEHIGKVSAGTYSIDSYSIDGYLCKYNNSGQVQWLFGVGGMQKIRQSVTSVSTDQNDNIYIIGTYNSPTTANPPFILANSNLNTSGGGDVNIFLLKLNSAGQPLWARQLGGPKGDFAQGLTVGSNGEVYVAGSYVESMTAGGLNLVSQATGGNREPFIAKYKPNGDIDWLVQGGCQSNGTGYFTSLCADTNNDVYAAGGFSGTVAFGQQPQSSTTGAMLVTKIIDNSSTGFRRSGGSSPTVFEVSPNPATGVFRISSYIHTGSEVKINALNARGRLVHSETIPYYQGPLSREIDLSKLPKGVYIIELITGSQRTAKKVVTQ